MKILLGDFNAKAELIFFQATINKERINLGSNSNGTRLVNFAIL